METLVESRKPLFQAVLLVEIDDGRMYPLVDDSPKCLLPLANRKLLAYHLDVLAKSGVMEVYIVGPSEYQTPLSQFLSEYMRESMTIDFVTVENMTGSCDGLRAVSDRLRGDFIFMSSDVFIKGGIGELTSMHRLKGGDVTMLLAPAPVEESDKKGGRKKLKIEEEDQEFIAFNDEHRILKKIPKVDLEENFVLNKPLLNRGGALSLRSDLLDLGVYIFSYWVLELVASSNGNRRFQSVRNDLLPFLVDHQHQPLSLLLEVMPSVCFRNRNMAAVEPWMHASEAALAQADGKHFELIDFLAKELQQSGSFTRGVSTVLVPPGIAKPVTAASAAPPAAADVQGAADSKSGQSGDDSAGDVKSGAGGSLSLSPANNLSMSALSDQLGNLDGLGGDLSPTGLSRDPLLYKSGAYVGGIHGKTASKNDDSTQNLTERDVLRCFAVITDESGSTNGHRSTLFGNRTSTQGFTNSSSKANVSSFVQSSASGLPSTKASASLQNDSSSKGGAKAGGGGAPAVIEPPLMLRLTSVATYQQLNRDITTHSYDSKTTPWPRVQGFQKKEQSVVGDNVGMADKVTVKACTLGNNITIGAKTKLNNCIVMDGVTIGDSVVLQNCVLCAGSNVGSSCNLNECFVAAKAEVAAGTKTKGENFAD